jgi:hypothetical protein
MLRGVPKLKGKDWVLVADKAVKDVWSGRATTFNGSGLRLALRRLQSAAAFDKLVPLAPFRPASSAFVLIAAAPPIVRSHLHAVSILHDSSSLLMIPRSAQLSVLLRRLPGVRLTWLPFILACRTKKLVKFISGH